MARPTACELHLQDCCADMMGGPVSPSSCLHLCTLWILQPHVYTALSRDIMASLSWTGLCSHELANDVGNIYQALNLAMVLY